MGVACQMLHRNHRLGEKLVALYHAEAKLAIDGDGDVISFCLNGNVGTAWQNWGLWRAVWPVHRHMPMGRQLASWCFSRH